jgi:hypothetical protein
MNTSLINGISDALNKPFIAPSNGSSINGIVKRTEKLVVNGHNYELTVPKFGRKKIAWT